MGISERELVEAAQLSSLADETPEGRSIVVLAKDNYDLRVRPESSEANFIEFSARTRMSGVDIPVDGHVHEIRKGAAAAVIRWVRDNQGHAGEDLAQTVDAVSASGGTPLVVAERQGTSQLVRLASSISRMWSRTACGNGSTSCGRWAFGR